MSYGSKRDDAELIANALSCSWRLPSLPPGLCEEGLGAITPRLIRSGAGALMWWRLRGTPLATTPPGLQLREAYRLHRLESHIHAKRVREIIPLLRAAGVEPVLVKGWSLARLYPEVGLRHYIDCDLCVAAEQHAMAERVLQCFGPPGSYVDLHRGLDHLDDSNWDEMFARTQMIELDDLNVRVLCPEDHLRVICVHWLRHGAWNPAGLCDIAVVLESLPETFDWNLCLGRDRVRANWVNCAIALAQQLLGAEIRTAHGSARAKAEEQGEREAGEAETTTGGLPLDIIFPRWIVPAVLRQWSRSTAPNFAEPALPALLKKITQPREFLNEVYMRWDQPVRATVALGGRFNNWPRLPYQARDLLGRTFAEIPNQIRFVQGFQSSTGTPVFL